MVSVRRQDLQPTYVHRTANIANDPVTSCAVSASCYTKLVSSCHADRARQPYTVTTTYDLRSRYLGCTALVNQGMGEEDGFSSQISTGLG